MSKVVDSLSNISSGLGSIMGTLSGVFDNGVEIYGSVSERIQALKLINQETVNEVTPVVEVTGENPLLSDNAKKIIFGSVGLVVAGVLIANLSK